MRKTDVKHRAMMILLTVVLAVFPAIPAFSLHPHGFNLSPFDHVSYGLQTPERLEKFMKKNFRYMSDESLFGETEYWQSPEEMLRRKSGDCEDFALFAKEVLERNGYRAFIFSVYRKYDAHTVTVFEKNGRWGIFDLDRLKVTDAQSVKDLGKEIKRRWDYVGLMRREGTIGVISRKIIHQQAENLEIGILLN